MEIFSKSQKSILWWGRSARTYSRNSILRNHLAELGYVLDDFVPNVSFAGGFEARLMQIKVPDIIWVPAFCHGDFWAARRYADRHHLPLVFDPLISSWDKQVFERGKYSDGSWRAERLKRWEQKMFSSADVVIADTVLHAQFFIEQLSAPGNRTFVVPVGAEEKLFTYQPPSNSVTPLEVLFYGSFINLQGPEIIVEAANLVPEVQWTMLGEGPLKKICQDKSVGCKQIRFEGWCSYEKLSERIGAADILLGIFGASRKAGRVIPNKVYQALACGRPLITRKSAAYPDELQIAEESGIDFIPAYDAKNLAAAVKNLVREKEALPEKGRKARASYEKWFSEDQIRKDLKEVFRAG